MYDVDEYDDYLRWLGDYIRADWDTYSHLLWILYNRPFTYVDAIDQNWVAHGLSLRDEYMGKVPMETLPVGIVGNPCTVLEVLIAMAEKMEEHLTDVEYGDRTALWFWEIIDNLGLKKFTDQSIWDSKMMDIEYQELNYIFDDEPQINKIIDVFLNREYGPNGLGGAFPIESGRWNQAREALIFQLGHYVAEKYFDE